MPIRHGSKYLLTLQQRVIAKPTEYKEKISAMFSSDKGSWFTLQEQSPVSVI